MTLGIAVSGVKTMDEPIFLRISPEVRRCVYYVLAASVPLALVAYWVNEFVGNKAPASGVARCASIFLFIIAMFVPLRYALRIDDQGISQRLLFWWVDLWTWAEISSGRIEKRHPYTLYDPSRPWWRRRLSLGFGHLAATDVARAMQRINMYYRLPSPPQLPDVLEIKYAFRRSARLDASGIHLQGRMSFGSTCGATCVVFTLLAWNLCGATSRASKSPCPIGSWN